MAKWFWNAKSNPFSTTDPDDWKEYSSEDNRTIEDAWSKKQEKVSLERYYVYFGNLMQVSRDDFHKQRPVKRVPL